MIQCLYSISQRAHSPEVGSFQFCYSPSMSNGLPSFHGDGIRLLGFLPLDRSPFEEAIDREYVTASPIGVPKRRQPVNGLAFGIDRLASALLVLAPIRDEGPADRVILRRSCWCANNAALFTDKARGICAELFALYQRTRSSHDGITSHPRTCSRIVQRFRSKVAAGVGRTVALPARSSERRLKTYGETNRCCRRAGAR